MKVGHRALSVLSLGLTVLSGLWANSAHSKQQLSAIRSAAVVSILGNQVDMQTLGMTKFDYEDYKLNSEWKLDEDIRNFVTNALKKRLIIKSGVNLQAFSGVKSSFRETLPDNIGTHIRSMSPAPDVDAIIVIYPNATDSLVANQLEVTHQAGFLFHGPSTIFASAYAVGIFDAKSGERIEFGTGRLPDHGYITGFSPAWEMCPNSMWADTETALSAEQKDKIHQELWSLITRSLPYALASAGLISESERNELATSALLPADPACHSI
ncbi:MAG: hypothetical protein JO056_08565 [Alphaproteobacteria bacterium]|nr:hypothetical protein [Alphaproteobacteria bacterium]